MLAIIQVGHNPASDLYIKNKVQDVSKAGLEARVFNIPEEKATTEGLIERVRHLSLTSEVSAIMVQLLLPESIDEKKVMRAISPDKDIDGLNPHSDYDPLTPCAIMRWIKNKYGSDYLQGKLVTILGRSDLVGKPLARLMIEAGATVVSCNSHTPNKIRRKMCSMSDVVVSAVGKIGVVDKKCVTYVIPAGLYIDVGINRDPVTNKMCGDIPNDVRNNIEALGGCCPPVPGSVGKWTVNELVLRLKEMEGISE